LKALEEPIYGGIELHIENEIYSYRSRRNLLRFKDILLNGYHIEIKNEGDVEYLC